MTAPLRLVGLSGGVGTPSSTTTLTRAVLERVGEVFAAEGVAVATQLLEVRDLARDATDEVLGGLRTPELDTALATLESAGILVVSTPIFRGSYAGVFKTVLDLLEPGSLRGVPTALLATSGTSRHTLVADHALRPLMSYFGAVTAPTAIVATEEDFVLGSRPSQTMAERIDRLALELCSLARGR